MVLEIQGGGSFGWVNFATGFRLWAFEDWYFNPSSPSDRDYNDLVVEIETISTPEPSTLLLVSSGLAVAAWRRRNCRRPADSQLG